MARKIVNNSDPGTSTKHGGDDVDYINQYLTGDDQVTFNADIVDINTDTRFRHTKFRLRDQANAFDYIFNTENLTADRDIFFPALTGSDFPLFVNQTQTISNKVMDVQAQTQLRGFLTDPVYKRWGSYSLLSGGPLTDGVLSNITPIGTATTAPSMDVSNGYYENYQTAGSVDDIAGIIPAAVLQAETIRRWNPDARTRFYTPSDIDQRMIMGFTTNTTIPTTNTFISNTDAGVIFGYRSTDANFSVFHNDGGGAMTVIDSGIPKDTAMHVLEIWFDNSIPTAYVTLDNTMIATITTALPAATDPLTFFWTVEQTTATQKDLRIYDIYYEDKKA